jgi:GNAT superfamily N-acetyltransferase
MPRIVTTHLQQLSPDALVPAARRLPDGCRIERAEDISAEFSKFLYRSVGSAWHWTDRLPLSRAEWEAAVRRPGTETWVLYAAGSPGGYVELAGAGGPDGTEVEIVYFGLFPERIGAGLGGALLEEGLRRAWNLHERWPGLAPVRRVWVHTCSLDGPAALGNYRARGLEVFRTEEADQEPQDASVGLWPRH